MQINKYIARVLLTEKEKDKQNLGHKSKHDINHVYEYTN